MNQSTDNKQIAPDKNLNRHLAIELEAESGLKIEPELELEPELKESSKENYSHA